MLLINLTKVVEFPSKAGKTHILAFPKINILDGFLIHCKDATKHKLGHKKSGKLKSSWGGTGLNPAFLVLASFRLQNE